MTTKSVDTTVGIITASVGGGGLTLQAVTDGASLILVALNIVLALGGIAWLVYRYRATRRKARNQRWNDT